MPAFISCSMTAAEWLAGPRVQTILARRTWAAFQLFCDEFMNRLVQEIDAPAEAGDGKTFVVTVHPQEIRLGQRKRNQSIRLHIVEAQIRRVSVPGAKIGNDRGAGKFPRSEVLDGLVKIGGNG